MTLQVDHLCMRGNGEQHEAQGEKDELFCHVFNDARGDPILLTLCFVISHTAFISAELDGVSIATFSC